MVGATPGAAGAAVSRARRRLIARFKDNGALDPRSTISYVPERGIERRLIEQLLEDGVLHQTRPSVYWLDEEQLALSNRRRRRRTGIIVGAAMALGAAIGFIASGG